MNIIEKQNELNRNLLLEAVTVDINNKEKEIVLRRNSTPYILYRERGDFSSALSLYKKHKLK